MSPRVLVILPALNESASVDAVVAHLRELGYDALVVDDGSTDATADVAAAAGATVLRLPINLGVGGALRCGFRYAVRHGYDVVVQVDADGQHDPSTVARLLEHMCETQADMVIGSRFASGIASYEVGSGRRLAMRVLAVRASASARTRITDATSGLRAIRRPLLDEFARSYPAEYLGDTVEALVIAARRGATIVEYPVEMSPRMAGQASAGLLSSAWYTLRLLLAVELMRDRRAAPTAMPGADAAP
jgi:glycosyltransferase involved in cell wall biosynthesis